MIEVRGVSFRIGATAVLEDVSFVLADGDFTAILGPNGAGKSTLLRILLGQIPEAAGHVLYDGVPARDWLREHHVGYLPQREVVPRMFPGTAADIVRLGLLACRGAFSRLPADSARRVRQALEMTGAAHLERRAIDALSGGELQRVLLARAIVGGSRYLFLDEPEAGVDSQQIIEFYSLLSRLNSEGRTILLVSHDINVILKTVSSVLCLNRTLHCHTAAELVSAEVVQKTWGEVLRLVDKHF